MEKPGVKRVRSEEEAPFIQQSKVTVSEKLYNSKSKEKMDLVYEKTIERLFEASRALRGATTEPGPRPQRPLWQEYIIYGNGKYDIYNCADKLENEIEEGKAKCCDRKAYICSTCTNCDMPLCENCGYSCSECRRFVCTKCVMVFGSGTPDKPLCEKCSNDLI